MSPLEAAFDEALKKNLREAETACGVVQKRLWADVERFGGAACARELGVDLVITEEGLYGPSAPAAAESGA